MLNDLHQALRSLRRAPGLTLAVILTLALGIGANSAIFSLLHGILLRSLPYAHGDELVVLQQSARRAGLEDMPFSFREVDHLRDATSTLADVVEYHQMAFTLLGGEEPERVRTGVVSPRLFEVFGIEALRGRIFEPCDGEGHAEPVLMLSHGYWQRRFGGEDAVLGRVFEMNDRPHTVIGVLPPIPQFPGQDDIYMPISACPFRAAAVRSSSARRAFNMMTAFGRRAPGVPLEEVRSELGTLAERFQADYPGVYPEDSGYRLDAEPLVDALTHAARPTLHMLVATAALVLLIACANVANLLLARYVRRERELAVRVALGAGRWRLLRQSLVESAVLTSLGALLGVALAYGSLDLLTTFLVPFTPRAEMVRIDGWVLAMVAALAALVALVVGLLPALGPIRRLRSALQAGSGHSADRGAQRMRTVLVAAQVAVSVVLLVGAIAMLRSLERLWQVDPGFRAEGVVTAQLPLNWSRQANSQDRLLFLDRLLGELNRTPGVEAAGFANRALLSRPEPLRPGTTTVGFQIEGRVVEEGGMAPSLDLRVVSPGYFEAVGIPLERGRLFDDRDRPEAPRVAVISRTAAQRYWGDEDPLGHRISRNGGQAWATVVGVVGDVKMYDLRTGDGVQVYEAMPQLTGVGVFWNLFVRASEPPEAMAQRVKKVVYSLDPEQPLAELEPLEARYAAAIAPPVLLTELLALFAGLALLITAAGISGVVAFHVSRRTREIGIRLALGATPDGVLGWVMRRSLGWCLAGLGVGLVATWGVEGVLAAQLFETEPSEPRILLAVALLLLSTAGVAAWVPARRAAQIAPTVALREE